MIKNYVMAARMAVARTPRLHKYNTYATAAHTAGSHSFQDYSQQEKRKILKLLNKANLNELLSYDLTDRCAGNLVAWKSRHGKIQSVDDLLQVDGFCEDTASQTFKKLLKEPIKKPTAGKTQGVRTGSFTTPSIDATQRMEIKSCVSLHIGVSSITWARVELQESAKWPTLLTHWHHYDIVGKKMHTSDLIRHCQYVDHLVPSADCYLFEDTQMVKTFNNPESVEQNINIQKAQITAVLAYTLLSRNHFKAASAENQNIPKEKSNIFFLRRFLTARLFNHLVGAECVSSEKAVLDIIKACEARRTSEGDCMATVDNCETQDSSDSGLVGKAIEFPPDLVSMFSQAERFHREFLGKVLLLNLAFIRLVLLQDPDSLANVARSPNKKPAN